MKTKILVAVILAGVLILGVVIGLLPSSPGIPSAPTKTTPASAHTDAAVPANDNPSRTAANAVETKPETMPATSAAIAPANPAPAPRVAGSQNEAEVPPPQSDEEAVSAAFKEKLTLRPSTSALFSYAYEHARNGDLTTMQKILDAHPEFITNKVGSYEATILHNSAYRSQTEIVADLLTRNPDVNALTAAGHTPLYDCVDGGNKEILLMLLQHGADFNIPAKDGKTPLQLATEKGRQDLVEILQKAGATQ